MFSASRPPMLRQTSITKQNRQIQQQDVEILPDPLPTFSSPYGRSTSAFDPIPAKRAKARVDYSPLNRGGLFRLQKSASYAVGNHAVDTAGSSNGTNSSSSSSLACGPSRTSVVSAAAVGGGGNGNLNSSNSTAAVHLPAVLRETSYSLQTLTGSSSKRLPQRVAQSQRSSRSASPHRNLLLPQQQQLRLSGALTMRAASGSKISVLQHQRTSPISLANVSGQQSHDQNFHPKNNNAPLDKLTTPAKNMAASNAANQSLYLIDLNSPMPNNGGAGGCNNTNSYQTPNSSIPNRLLFSHLRAASGGPASWQKTPQFLQNNQHNGVIDAVYNASGGGSGQDMVDVDADVLETDNNSNNSSNTSNNNNNNEGFISPRLTNTVDRLNDTNNSTDDIKREAMSDIRLMFKQRSAEWPAIWDVHFDKVLHALMIAVVKGRSNGAPVSPSNEDVDGAGAMNENIDYELRTRALSLLAVMAQMEPNRMEKYAEYVIVELLEARCVVEPKAGIETRRAFSALNKPVEECALQVGLALSFKCIVQILLPLIKSTNYPLNESAIKMFGNVIRNIPAEQVRECIDNHQELVKMLVKQFDEGQQISIRKESVFALAYLVHKLGKEYFFNLPCVAGLDGSRKRLIKLYVGKTSSLPSSGGSLNGISEAAAVATEANRQAENVLELLHETQIALTEKNMRLSKATKQLKANAEEVAALRAENEILKFEASSNAKCDRIKRQKVASLERQPKRSHFSSEKAGVLADYAVNNESALAETAPLPNVVPACATPTDKIYKTRVAAVDSNHSAVQGLVKNLHMHERFIQNKRKYVGPYGGVATPSGKKIQFKAVGTDLARDLAKMIAAPCP